MLVKTTDEVKNLGVMLDKSMTKKSHVNNMGKKAFLNIKNISRISKSLNKKSHQNCSWRSGYTSSWLWKCSSVWDIFEETTSSPELGMIDSKAEETWLNHRHPPAGAIVKTENKEMWSTGNSCAGVLKNLGHWCRQLRLRCSKSGPRLFAAHHSGPQGYPQ